nr:Uma2 family endonuclease [Acidobacteriota bacterium]
NIIGEQEYDFGGNAHGPDVSFVKASKVHLFDCDRRVQPLVPDLAIEIVSKSDGYNSLSKKARRYCDCGTQEAWIFSIDMRHAVRYSGKQAVIFDETAEFASDLISGFSIRLAELFDRI